jgi:hypothetical protein
LFSCKFLLYSCLEPFFPECRIFLTNSSYHNLMLCPKLFVSTVCISRKLQYFFCLSSLAPFVVFRPLSYVLESPWKKSEEKGALYVARKKSFKELNISSTPLGSQSVISTIIQITFRDRWAIPLVIYKQLTIFTYSYSVQHTVLLEVSGWLRLSSGELLTWLGGWVMRAQTGRQFPVTPNMSWSRECRVVNHVSVV